MNFTRNYTTENMFRDYLGVHPNTFGGTTTTTAVVGDNESHSTEHTQKTKGAAASVMMIQNNLSIDENSVGNHRGNSSPQKTHFYNESSQSQSTPSKKSSKSQSQSQSSSLICNTARPSRPKQKQQQPPPQRGNSIEVPSSTRQAQHRTTTTTTTTTTTQSSSSNSNYPPHPHRRSSSAPASSSSSSSAMKRASSVIGASAIKFIGCFDGVCDSVSDWWGDNCVAEFGGKHYYKQVNLRGRGRSRTSRREKDHPENYYKCHGVGEVGGYEDDNYTYGTYSDGSRSTEEDDSLSYEYGEDVTYDSYDDDYLARDLQRRRRRRNNENNNPEDDDDSLNSLERQRKWKQAKMMRQEEALLLSALEHHHHHHDEPAIVRQRRIRMMEQERLAIEEQRERFHASQQQSSSNDDKALSAISFGKRSTTVSTAHTELIQNTLTRKLIIQQQQQEQELEQEEEEHQQQQGERSHHDYENTVQGGTEWPDETNNGGNNNNNKKNSSHHKHDDDDDPEEHNSATSDVVIGDEDEARRAFDWIHDPTKREQAWLKASNNNTDSNNSIESRKRKEEDGSVRSIPLLFDQQAEHNNDKVFQHWKKLDDKVQAERMQLQAKHALESKALRRKRQEQDELLQQRLNNMMLANNNNDGQDNNNAIPAIIPTTTTTDGSDHDHETYVLQLEQEKEVQQKEQELEILQGAIHQRLAMSPSAHERRERLLLLAKNKRSNMVNVNNIDDTTTTMSQQDKEKEWLEAFKKRQAEIEQQEELTKKQLEKSLVTSNHKPKVPTTTDVSLDGSITKQLDSSTDNKRGPAVKFSTKQEDEEASVPPLPAFLETKAPPPPSKSPEEHKQHITSSFDSEDQQSLEPNPRSKPIQCKVELPTLPVVDEEKEKRLAEQKRKREEFKASRLKALAASAGGENSTPLSASHKSSSNNGSKDPVSALVDDVVGGDGNKSKNDDFKASMSQESHPSMLLQQNELTVGMQSFSNMDDISVLTPASTKTMETTQTTQTAQTSKTNVSKKSSKSLPTPSSIGSTSRSTRTPVMPPTIRELQGGKKRGESPRLSAKRKELEWMWNAAKKPLQQLEEEQRLKQKRNRIKKLQSIASPGGLEDAADASVGSSSSSTRSNSSSKKRVVEYAPGVTPVDRMPTKVWTKRKGAGSSVTTATTVSSHSSEDEKNKNSRRDLLLLDKPASAPPKKNRVSQLVKKQRELSERHRRKNNNMNLLLRDGRHSPSVSVVPEESDVPSVVTNTTTAATSIKEVSSSVSSGSEKKPNVSLSSSQATPVSLAPSDEVNHDVTVMVTPEKEDTAIAATGPVANRRAVSTQKASFVTPEKKTKPSPSRVMNFWEQKEQEQLAKQAKQERQQKRESWNQKWSPSTPRTTSANLVKKEPDQQQMPLSKIELKRRELAAKRKAFQKHKEQAAKRLEQELGVAPSASNLDDSQVEQEDKKKIDTKELVGKFEELKVVLSSPPSKNNTESQSSPSLHVHRRPPAHRCLADRKQKELDRRNEEYLNSLSQFGRSTSHDTHSSTAWPDMEPSLSRPRNIYSNSRFANDDNNFDAQSNQSVPEKEISRNQQLRQAWRQRAWKTIDTKVDRDGFPSIHHEQQLGAKAVQKVLGKSNRLAMLTEQY